MSVSHKVTAIVVVVITLITSSSVFVMLAHAERTRVAETNPAVENISRLVAHDIEGVFVDALTTTELIARTFSGRPSFDDSAIHLPSSLQFLCVIDENGEQVAQYGSEDKKVCDVYVGDLAAQSIAQNAMQYAQSNTVTAGASFFLGVPFSVGPQRFALVSRVRWNSIEAILHEYPEYTVRVFAATRELLASSEIQDHEQLFTEPVFSKNQIAEQRVEIVIPNTPFAFTVIASIAHDTALVRQLLPIYQLLIISCAAAILAGIVLLVLMQRYVFQPLQVLSEMARRYAQGELSERVPVRTHDEFGVVSQYIHKLAHDMHEVRNGLEDVVAMRTQELQEKIVAFQHTQRSLQEEKAKDDALFSGITDAIIVIDPKGVIVKVNTIATQLLDQHDVALVGKRWRDVARLLYENEEVSTDRDPATYALKGTVCTSTAYALRTQRGKILDVACSAAPMFLHGKSIGALIVLRDITSTRQVERAKTEFVTLASHQLRTPLSSSRWYAELLLSKESGKLTAKQKTYAQEVYAGIQRMIRLVNALLQLSTFENQSVRIQGKVSVTLADVVTQIVEESKKTIREKELRIVSRALPQNLKVFGDGVMVSMIVQALLDNAIEYTPKKGTITVRVFSASAGQVVCGKVLKTAMHILELRDTGYGIPQSERMHIFQKFYRASNVKEHSANGNGISLYLARMVVRQLRGLIWFESSEGQGTTFVVGFQPVKAERKR